MSQWVEWVKQLQSIGQAGKAYSKDKFDLERFEQLTTIAHEMFAELSNTPVKRVSELFIPETGYPTPKVDLRAAVIKDNKILLVREREDDCWSLPGGWADVSETPSQGIIREVFEESGYVVNSPRLVVVKDRDVHPYYPKFPYHIYKMFFLCQFESGEAMTNIEISDIGFFGLDELPRLSEGRVLPSDIELMFEYFNDADKPVYVD